MAFPSLISYVTVQQADLYFSARLNSDPWFTASQQQKMAALITSTKDIDRLDFVGVKWCDDQETEWPRIVEPYFIGNVTALITPNTADPYSPLPGEVLSSIPEVRANAKKTFPDAILAACCENAFVLLAGKDMELEMESADVETSTFSGVRETYSQNTAHEATRHGIASLKAWVIMYPWFRDNLNFSLCRV